MLTSQNVSGEKHKVPDDIGIYIIYIIHTLYCWMYQ